MKRKNILLVFSLMFLVFISCTPLKVPQTVSVQEEAEKKAEVSTLLPREEEWQKLIKEAKKEGNLSIIGNWDPWERETFSKAFWDKFGINLELTTGRGGEIGEKLVREKRAGLHLADLYIGGSTTAVTVIKHNRLPVPFEQYLILPEVKDEKLWYGGKLPWIDKERLILVYGKHVAGQDYLTINTQLVKEGEIKSFKDLLNPKWKGKIVQDDPTISGKGLKAFSVTTRVGNLGLDYWRQLSKQEPLLLRDKRLEVEWMARGKYPIGIAMREEWVNEFASLGASLAMVDTSEAIHTLGPRSATILLEKAPHPNAARLFLNWILTREGQTLWVKATKKYQSAREDVTTEYTPANSRRVPGVQYFDADREEFLLGELKDAQLAREIFGHLLR